MAFQRTKNQVNRFIDLDVSSFSSWRVIWPLRDGHVASRFDPKWWFLAKIVEMGCHRGPQGVGGGQGGSWGCQGGSESRLGA